MYAELQKVLERCQAELVELISSRQKQAEDQAKELAQGLEQELNLLKRRSNELETLAHTQDKVIFLQVHKSGCPNMSVQIHPPIHMYTATNTPSIHTHTHTHIYSSTHAHTHTHTPPQPSLKSIRNTW